MPETVAAALSYDDWARSYSGFDAGLVLDPADGPTWPRHGLLDGLHVVFDLDGTHAFARVHAGSFESTPVLRTAYGDVAPKAVPTQVMQFLLTRLVPATRLNPTFEVASAIRALGPSSSSATLLDGAGTNRTRTVLAYALARACTELSALLAHELGDRELVDLTRGLVAAPDPESYDPALSSDIDLIAPEAAYLVAWTLLVLVEHGAFESPRSEELAGLLYPVCDQRFFAASL